MPPLRILFVDEDPERRDVIAGLLRSADCELLATVSPESHLLEQVERYRPDLVIIDLESPGRDTLESLREVQSRLPRPMVMFSQDDDGEAIKRAVQAGVSAYVVDDIENKRVRPIIEAAIARFEQFRAVEQELDRAKGQLAERRVIEKAKGLIMQQRRLSEADAYQALRKSAMDRNQRLIDVAHAVIAASDLLLDEPPQRENGGN